MYSLLVSHDCGCSYHKEGEAETLDELRPKMVELDASTTRWCLEKDGEDCFEEVCAIFSGIMRVMAQANTACGG